MRDLKFWQWAAIYFGTAVAALWVVGLVYRSWPLLLLATVDTLCAGLLVGAIAGPEELP